jgi:hypothetical protein
VIPGADTRTLSEETRRPFQEYSFGDEQEIFDTLPGPMNVCLTEVSKSFARLYFISGVTGSGITDEIIRYGVPDKRY